MIPAFLAASTALSPDHGSISPGIDRHQSLRPRGPAPLTRDPGGGVGVSDEAVAGPPTEVKAPT